MSRSDTEHRDRTANLHDGHVTASPKPINTATWVMVAVLALIVIVGILVLSGIYTAGPR